jgi:hypothetical protein
MSTDTGELFLVDVLFSVVWKFLFNQLKIRADNKK